MSAWLASLSWSNAVLLLIACCWAVALMVRGLIALTERPSRGARLNQRHINYWRSTNGRQ